MAVDQALGGGEGKGGWPQLTLADTIRPAVSARVGCKSFPDPPPPLEQFAGLLPLTPTPALTTPRALPCPAHKPVAPSAVRRRKRHAAGPAVRRTPGARTLSPLLTT